MGTMSFFHVFDPFSANDHIFRELTRNARRNRTPVKINVHGCPVMVSPDAMYSRQNLKMRDVPQQPVPGLQYIGCGYDLFARDEIFSPSRFKERLLDVSPDQFVEKFYSTQGREYKTLPFVTVYNTPRSYTRRIRGATARHFQKELSHSYTSGHTASGFSASVITDFSDTQIKNIYNHFSQFSEIFEIWKLHMTRERLFEHLHPQAREDIESMSPDILFDKYGGYVTNSFVIGGRIVVNCCTDAFTYEQSSQINRCLEMMHRNLLRKPEQIEHSRELDDFMGRSDVSVLTLGGDHQYGGRSIREHFEHWRQSLHEKPTFVDFSGNTGLTPIWDLSENPQRRVLLQQAFADYAERIEDPIDLQPSLSTRREVQYEIITKTSSQQREYDHVDVVIRVNGLWDRMQISLDDPDIENFKPDAEDRFCVAWRDLGEINSITLENLGCQGWNVDSVVIRNMDTNYTERFDCQCNLERDEGYPDRKTFYASMTQKQPVNA